MLNFSSVITTVVLTAHDPRKIQQKDYPCWRINLVVYQAGHDLIARCH